MEKLETISKQSSMMVETMRFENENLLEQISVYFQSEDEDSKLRSLGLAEQEIPTVETLSQHFTSYQSQLRTTVSSDKILEVYQSANELITEGQWSNTETDKKVCLIVH